MPKDRLQELRASLPADYYRDSQVTLVVETSINADEKSITVFLAKAGGVLSSIESIKTNTNELKKLHAIILSLPRSIDKINADVEERISSVQHAIRFVRNSLQEMEMQIQDTDGDTTALTRIKTVQHSTLSKLFMEAIQEYNSTLVRHRERCANLLKQQLRITDKTVNYEELQELLDREESAIFVDNIISESLEAQLSLDAAKARHEELIKVEKSIAEIKDVFVEIALLVEDQGSKLDSIAHHVNKAMGNSVHGTKKLEKAKKRKRKYKRRKWKCIILLVAILVLLILLVIILP